jgi:HK97 gp10 family phage protein
MSNSFNHFQDIADALAPFLSEAVEDTAQDIVDTYQATAPVDTGFMADSAYIESFARSTYGQGGFGGANQDLLDEIETPPDEFTAYAAVGASYAEFVETGTVHMGPQPAFYPAVESAADYFENRLDGLEDYLKGVL